MKKKINVPKVIDLGCNNKARVVDVNGDCYRLNDIYTNTTWRHWGAFVDYIGLASIRKGADFFRSLPAATAA